MRSAYLRKSSGGIIPFLRTRISVTFTRLPTGVGDIGLAGLRGVLEPSVPGGGAVNIHICFPCIFPVDGDEFSTRKAPPRQPRDRAGAEVAAPDPRRVPGRVVRRAPPQLGQRRAPRSRGEGPAGTAYTCRGECPGYPRGAPRGEAHGRRDGHRAGRACGGRGYKVFPGRAQAAWRHNTPVEEKIYR